MDILSYFESGKPRDVYHYLIEWYKEDQEIDEEWSNDLVADFVMWLFECGFAGESAKTSEISHTLISLRSDKDQY